MSKIDAETLRQRISQYTNSQNEMSLRDMNWNRKGQAFIQENISLNYDGFFWERKTGERQLHIRKSQSFERKHKPQSLRIMDNLEVAKISYGYEYEKPIEAVRLKETEIFDLDDKIYKKIFENIPPKTFVISWILDIILAKSIQYIQDKKNQPNLQSYLKGYPGYEYESISKLLSSEYAKRTCLALVHHFLKKNQKFDKIEEAILSFMKFSASKNGKQLNKANGISNEQKEHIIPIFLCVMQFFDIVFRHLFFGGKSLSEPEIEPKEIREIFQIQEVKPVKADIVIDGIKYKKGELLPPHYSTYCKILEYMVSSDKMNNGRFATLIDDLSEKIITEANSLDS